MRRQCLFLTLSSLGLGLGACGSLDNEPFRAGTVRGRLTEFDPAVALVSVIGAPGVRASVDAQGRFTLEDVPAGPAELFVVATEDKAARVPLTVQGGQSVDVPDVAPRPAGSFFVKLHTQGSPRVTDAKASVDGTPIDATQLDDRAPRRLGPLPDGCYGLSVSAPGFISTAVQGCVDEGKQTALNVELVPEEGFAEEGCARTGCDDDSHCALDGHCVECLDTIHCESSEVCNGFRCEETIP
ncbi:carboxypeptidase-like regulatory domain-containing protein [Corallococcus carmarthensis]|uniref:Carboxypeptidase regulatory-like domain-containing protein n=1 Tax=Corallococcus carmarthensis TaxID=2316728 RepID=A0A3A8KFB9_9BACT|nr:carboxypeptidase-like regulatory domain-containing protein [Corallococcus carmarthensis]NOK17104.1 carboxypeptidase regulatory-like domain-containing protein [Corallococcus carmarthensis]RKH06226.1 carboxypeptidase regulatory-like domain-containing protein [Corallococcus carmarthensis]